MSGPFGDAKTLQDDTDDRGALVREAARKARKNSNTERKVTFHTVTPHMKWKSEVLADPSRLQRLFKSGADGIAAIPGTSSSPLYDQGKSAEAPAKHVTGVGIIDDVDGDVRTKANTNAKAERFVRSKRPVKSLNLPLS